MFIVSKWGICNSCEQESWIFYYPLLSGEVRRMTIQEATEDLIERSLHPNVKQDEVALCKDCRDGWLLAWRELSDF